MFISPGTKKIIQVSVIVAMMAAPILTFAAPSWWPIVPCGLQAQPSGIAKSVHDYTQTCNQCLLVELFKNLIDLTFFGIVPILGTFFFLLGGFFILTGGGSGNSSLVARGKSIFWDTAIGIAIVLSSWLITNSILKTLAAGDRATNWYQIQCSTGTLSDLVNATLPHPPTPTPTGSVAPSPSGSGTDCGQGTNLCQAAARQCSAASCGQYVSAINQYASGAASANLLKAIMVQESSCNPQAASAGGSYGLMQLQPGTANLFRSQCGVSVTIDSTWLTNPANAQASICIAARYLNSLASGQCGSSVRNIAAGYNGGAGACDASVDCANDRSCSSETVKKWECVFDDAQHSVCNTGFNETRDYATKVLYCNNNPGF